MMLTIADVSNARRARIAFFLALIGAFLSFGLGGAWAQSPPVIDGQPSSGTYLVGSDVVLATTISGTGPFAFQWQFNGTNLPNYFVSSAMGGGLGDGGPAIGGNIAPHDVAVDFAGNIYIVDAIFNIPYAAGHHRIRRIGTNGIVTTLAGSAKQGFDGDGGFATNASLSYPYLMAIDPHGNVFFTDASNQRIRRVSINGIITTVAGNGTAGFSGDGGPATQASLKNPEGIAVDTHGNLYIADYDNYRLRKVGPDGIISTIAGDGVKRFFGDGGPATNASFSYPKAVAVDGDGNIFVTDALNYRVRKIAPNGIITTFAGNGVNGYSGNGGKATQASMTPCRIAVDSLGNVIVAEANNRVVRKISKNGFIDLVPFAGIASFPEGVGVDLAGNVFLAVPGNGVVLKCDTNGVTTTVAKNPASPASAPINYDDGHFANESYLNSPRGVVMDSEGQLIVSDTLNHRVRRVGIDGRVTTIAGNGTPGFSGDGGAATNAELNFPGGLAIDAASNLFIADTSNNVVRMVTQAGIITTFAGTGTPGGTGDGGAATNATLSGPLSVAVDKIGNLIVADSGSLKLRKIDTNGIISRLAGGGNGQGTKATNARFLSINGVAVDSIGNMFVSDPKSFRVLKIGTNGNIGPVAGNGIQGFAGDGGSATNARLVWPTALAVDGLNNLLIADTTNGRIRMVSGDATIRTIAGGVGGKSSPGPTNTYLSSPVALAVNQTGTLLVADSVDNRIWSLPLTGSSSLTINRLTPAASGAYQLIVSNRYGSDTSHVAVVDVGLPPLSISMTPQDQPTLECSAPPDSNLILQTAASLVPPILWQPVFTNATDINSAWSYDGSATNGASAVFYRLTAQ